MQDYSFGPHVYADDISIRPKTVRPRPQVVAARVTIDEKKAIAAAAEAANLPVSEFALRIVLGRAESILNPGSAE